MRYMGIDYGAKKTGIALSDDAGLMGFPNRIIDTTNHLSEEVCSLAEAEHVGAFVVGISKNLQGKENEISSHIRTFAESLMKQSGKPVYFEDEAFTTFEARREEGSLRSDASAAALILSRFLEKQPGRPNYDDYYR